MITELHFPCLSILHYLSIHLCRHRLLPLLREEYGTSTMSSHVEVRSNRVGAFPPKYCHVEGIVIESALSRQITATWKFPGWGCDAHKNKKRRPTTANRYRYRRTSFIVHRHSSRRRRRSVVRGKVEREIEALVSMVSFHRQIFRRLIWV